MSVRMDLDMSTPDTTNVPDVPVRIPLVPERSDFLDGGAPAATKVEAFLSQAMAATGTPSASAALVPWICDAADVKSFREGLRPGPHGLRPTHAGAGSGPAARHRRPR